MVMMTACAPTVRPSRSLIPRRAVFECASGCVRDRRLSSTISSATSACLMCRFGSALEHLAHLQAVLLLVALRAGRPHGRAARGVQQAELDADGVGDLAHDAAEGVDFADEVSLGDAADGGIAGHLRDEIDVQGEERGAQAHAGGGHRGLASGMAGADHDYVVCSVNSTTMRIRRGPQARLLHSTSILADASRAKLVTWPLHSRIVFSRSECILSGGNVMELQAFLQRSKRGSPITICFAIRITRRWTAGELTREDLRRVCRRLLSPCCRVSGVPERAPFAA